MDVFTSVLASQSAPDWYFKSPGLGWWIGNLFDTAVEIHAFQLGLLIGLLIGVLTVQSNQHVSGFVLLIIVAFLFGMFEVPYLCASQTTSCAHVQLKPWYFLTGVLLAQIGIIAISAKLTGLRTASPTKTFRTRK